MKLNRGTKLDKGFFESFKAETTITTRVWTNGTKSNQSCIVLLHCCKYISYQCRVSTQQAKCGS